MGQYRKKPIEVTAERFEGSQESIDRILEVGQGIFLDWKVFNNGGSVLSLETLTTLANVLRGSWVIIHENEVYVLDDKTFHEYYDRVEVYEEFVEPDGGMRVAEGQA